MIEPSRANSGNAAVFAGLALAACLPLAFVDGLYSEYALPKIAVLSCGLLISAAGLLRSGALRAPAPALSPLEKSLFLAFCVLAAAAFFSRDPILSFLGFFNDYAYGLYFRLLCLAAFLMAARGLDQPARDRLADVCAWAAGAAGLYAALQTLGIASSRHPEGLPDGRAFGASGNPVHLGTYLAMLLPFSIHRAFAAAGKRRVALGAAALCILFGLAACFSRGAWLAAAAGLAAYAILSGRAASFLKRPEAEAAPKTLWLALVPFVLAFCVFAWNGLMTRRPTGLSDAGRHDAWSTSWSVFRSRPLLGTGPETFSIGSRSRRSEAFLRAAGSSRLYHAHAHNEFLEALATTGILGAGAQLLALLAFFSMLKKRMSDPSLRDAAAGTAAAFTALLINLQFNPASMESWTAAALVAATAAYPVKTGSQPASPAWPLGAACAVAALAWPVPVQLIRADRAYVLATQRTLEGKTLEALDEARRAVLIHPWEARYRLFHGNTALTLARSGDAAKGLAYADEALASARKFAALHPDDADSHYFLGLALMVRGQLAKDPGLLTQSARSLDKALELDPTFKPLLRLRAELAAVLGERSRSDEIAAVLARLEPLAKD